MLSLCRGNARRQLHYITAPSFRLIADIWENNAETYTQTFFPALPSLMEIFSS